MKSNKKVTLKDIANKANVSITTVSNVINSKNTSSYSESKKLEILDYVEKLDYKGNFRPMGSGKNHADLIAVMLPSYMLGGIQESPFYYYLISGIENTASNHDIDVILKFAKENHKVEQVVAWVKSRNLKGIIFVGVINESYITALNKLDIPIVLIDNYSKIQLKNVHYINTMDQYGGTLAARHLVNQGYRKIGILTSSLHEAYVDYHRYIGFKNELNSNDLHETLVLVTTTTYQEGFDISGELINLGLDAVFCTSDDLAFGVIDGLSKNNVAISQQFGVIGFDDFSRSRENWLPLTTISQDVIKKGELAVDTLLQHGNINKHIRVSVKLIHRKTT